MPVCLKDPVAGQTGSLKYMRGVTDKTNTRAWSTGAKTGRTQQATISNFNERHFFCHSNPVLPGVPSDIQHIYGSITIEMSYGVEETQIKMN